MKRWILVAAGPIVLVPLLLFVWLAVFVTPGVRADLVTSLARGYGHDVELGALHWRFLPRFSLRGERLQVGGNAVDAVPPLVTVDTFDVDADLRALLRQPREIRAVTLRGLRVHVPAGGAADQEARAGDASREAAPGGDVSRASESPKSAVRHAPDAAPSGEHTTSVAIGELLAEDARVEIASSRADRPPRVYEIHDLRLSGLATDRAVDFEAALIHPHPRGDVITSGTFGPWNRAAARDTPLAGRYGFADADLSVFRGIGGVLDSTGTFDGTLGDLAVAGHADIADFVVSPANQPVRLQAEFAVRVSDAAADLQLRPVGVRFEQSDLLADGEIVRRDGDGGRTIVMDVTSARARVEDVLKFALTARTPPLTGDLDLTARLEIPPGDTRVIEKMRLEGEFVIERARFTNLDVQSTLDRVSRLTRGQAAGERGGSTVSNLQGAFTLDNANVNFSRLSFGVPGTRVQLAGRLGLVDDSLDLRGRLLLDRAPSQLARGRAGGLLGLIDPLVRRADAGAGVPITITGPRDAPAFRVDLDAFQRELPQWRELFRRFTEGPPSVK